jgi:hypothetical protein
MSSRSSFVPFEAQLRDLIANQTEREKENTREDRQ